jgi:hypothetical protein
MSLWIYLAINYYRRWGTEVHPSHFLLELEKKKSDFNLLKNQLRSSLIYCNTGDTTQDIYLQYQLQSIERHYKYLKKIENFYFIHHKWFGKRHLMNANIFFNDMQGTNAVNRHSAYSHPLDFYYMEKINLKKKEALFMQGLNNQKHTLIQNLSDNPDGGLTNISLLQAWKNYFEGISTTMDTYENTLKQASSPNTKPPELPKELLTAKKRFEILRKKIQPDNQTIRPLIDILNIHMHTLEMLHNQKTQNFLQYQLKKQQMLSKHQDKTVFLKDVIQKEEEKASDNRLKGQYSQSLAGKTAVQKNIDDFFQSDHQTNHHDDHFLANALQLGDITPQTIHESKEYLLNTLQNIDERKKRKLQLLNQLLRQKNKMADIIENPNLLEVDELPDSIRKVFINANTSREKAFLKTSLEANKHELQLLDLQKEILDAHESFFNSQALIQTFGFSNEDAQKINTLFQEAKNDDILLHELQQKALYQKYQKTIQENTGHTLWQKIYQKSNQQLTKEYLKKSKETQQELLQRQTKIFQQMITSCNEPQKASLLGKNTVKKLNTVWKSMQDGFKETVKGYFKKSLKRSFGL